MSWSIIVRSDYQIVELRDGDPGKVCVQARAQRRDNDCVDVAFYCPRSAYARAAAHRLAAMVFDTIGDFDDNLDVTARVLDPSLAPSIDGERCIVRGPGAALCVASFFGHESRGNEFADALADDVLEVLR